MTRFRSGGDDNGSLLQKYILLQVEWDMYKHSLSNTRSTRRHPRAGSPAVAVPFSSAGLMAGLLDGSPKKLLSSLQGERDSSTTEVWRTGSVDWNSDEVVLKRKVVKTAGVGEQLRGRNLLEAIETAKDHDSASGETRKAGVPVKVASGLDAYVLDNLPSSFLWEGDLTATNGWKTEYVGWDPKEVSPMRTVENMAGVGEQLRGRNLLEAIETAKDHDSASGETRKAGVPVKVASELDAYGFDSSPSILWERDLTATNWWKTEYIGRDPKEVSPMRTVENMAGVGEQLKGRNLLDAMKAARDHDSGSGEKRKPGVPVKVATGLDAYVLDNLPSSFLWEGDLTATNGWKTEYVGWDPKEVSPMRTAENMAGVGEQLRGRNLLEAIETAKDHDSASRETRKAGIPVKVASELDAYVFDSSPSSFLWERDLTATNWWKTEYIGRDPKEVSPMRTVENMAGVGEQLKGRNLLDAMKSARDHDSGSGEKREPGVPVKVMDLTATNGQRTGCVGPDPDEVPLMWTAVSVAGIGDLQRVRSLLNAIEAPRGHDSGSGETRKAGVPVKVASERDAHVFDNSPPSFQGKRDLATTNGWRTGCVGWDLDEVSLMSTVENMAGVGEQQSIRNLLDAIKAARDHDSESGKTRKPGVPVNVSSDYAPDTPISRSSSCDFFPPADSNSSSTSSDVTTNKHASGHRGSSSSSVMGTRGKGERSMDTQAGVVSTRGAVHLREERGRRTVGMPWVNLALLIVVLVAAAAFWLVHPEEEDGSFIPT